MQGIFLNPLWLLKLKSWIWEGNFWVQKGADSDVKWTETTGLEKSTASKQIKHNLWFMTIYGIWVFRDA